MDSLEEVKEKEKEKEKEKDKGKEKEKEKEEEKEKEKEKIGNKPFLHGSFCFLSFDLIAFIFSLCYADISRKYMEWLGKELKYSSLDSWHSVSVYDFYKHHGSSSFSPPSPLPSFFHAPTLYPPPLPPPPALFVLFSLFPLHAISNIFFMVFVVRRIPHEQIRHLSL